jgi:uncharacterized membrane protein (DUF106 family)
MVINTLSFTIIMFINIHQNIKHHNNHVYNHTILHQNIKHHNNHVYNHTILLNMIIVMLNVLMYIYKHDYCEA